MNGNVTLQINGKTVRRQRMRSFVYNWISAIKALTGDSSATARDTSGNTHATLNTDSVGAGQGGWYITTVPPGIGIDGRGIQVGSGSAAVAMGDYALATKIATGSGAGQLNYQAQTVGAASTVGLTTTVRVSRSFINNSGGAITVRELGLVIELREVGIANFPFLICRDVVTPTVVNAGDTLNVFIDLKVTA
jgi:hypothetical protein